MLKLTSIGNRSAQTLTKKLLAGILKLGKLPPSCWLTRLRGTVKPLRTLRFVHGHKANVIQKHPPRSLSTDPLVLDLEGSIPGKLFRFTIRPDNDHMHPGTNRVTGADISRIKLLSRKARGIESMKSQAKKGAA